MARDYRFDEDERYAMKISLPSSVSFALVSVVVVVACGGNKPAIIVENPAPDCPTTGSRECHSAEDCGHEIHCTAGRCFANQAGCPCSDTPDCGANAHCTKGMCYPNKVGVPCSAPTDCGSRAHCTGDSCYANTTGSPCNATPDCGPSSACVSGTCN